jgi:Protein of unknown function (DUF2927)
MMAAGAQHGRHDAMMEMRQWRGASGGWAGRVGATALALASMVPTQAQSPTENQEISARRAAQTRSFTDAQIIDGFFKVTFGAEFHTTGRIDRIRKFDVPIRAYVDSRASPDRTEQIGQVVADIKKRIDNLDIAMTTDQRAANLMITLVRDRDLDRTIVSRFGREHARKIESALEPQCLAGFRKDESYRITRAEVIIVVDAGDFVFFDCAYEEILQSLGPINDDQSVPWTMFNDDVQMGFFDVYDQYLLNLLYHDRMRPGMTREQAHAVIAEILSEVRAFVARNNDLGP